MKILHVAISLTPESGGPTTAVTGLTEALAKQGLDISLFAPTQRKDAKKVIPPKGVSLSLFEQGVLARRWPGYSLGITKALTREINDFDLIHIHELWGYPHFAAYHTAKNHGKPYIVSVHGGLHPWAINHKALKKAVYSALVQRRILRRAAALHALSHEEAKHIKAFGIENRTAIIPNAIDLKEYRSIPTRRDLEQLYPQIAGKQVVLFLGRIHPIKGLDVLANAFGQIARHRNELRLLVVGPDSEGYKNNVVKILQSYGVLDQVIFTGMLTERKKLAALGGADIFVHPAYSEGFSMAILEALASRLPAIITRQCGNFPEIADANAGIIIEPESNQLAAALEQLLDNPGLRQEMGDRGWQLINRKFGWSTVANQMRDLYASVLSK